MRLTILLRCLFFIAIPFFASAQLVGTQTDTKSSEQALSPYYEAEALAHEADSQLKAGEVIKADALIRTSIKMYPTKAVYEYAKSLCRISDVKTANEIMEQVFAQLDMLAPNSIFLPDYTPEIVDGKQVYPLKQKDLQRAKLIFGSEALKVNQEFGDRANMIKILEMIVALNIDNNAKLFKPDVDYIALANYNWMLAVAKNDYPKAIAYINQIPKSAILNSNIRYAYLADVYFQAEDFENTAKSLEKLSGTYSSIKDLYNFKIYASSGKNAEALESLEKYNKFMKKVFPDYSTNNDILYYLAVIDLSKKNYTSALENLNKSLSHKNKVGNSDLTILLDRWKVYKLIGDAYTGLQQFEKAKDHYNLSLLFYPDYEPTKSALVQLESLVVTTTATDNTPPVITVTEPSVKRGLEIVTAGTDILVRGTAQDPSGLQSVTINGQLVFSQADGNFWGNIVLKEGITKIIVKATDGAGNASEHTFEIEKKIAVATSDIVPVVVKEGKNFCLLIGAQNYEDINIPSLENPIQDAVRLKLILKKDYDFEEGTIFTLFNPSANDVKRQLLELTTVIQPEDNLLIFYAGHGIWVEKEKKGYWLLVDAKRNDSATWLQNKDVLNLIAKLPSRHTLLITDACFSGGVFKTRSLGKNAPAALKTMDEKISRVAITSGNDTEVPDESVFMKYLVKALTENKEKYLTAQKMFINQIMEAVMTETKTEPRYGTLELAGHVGGDYIFAKK